MCPDQKLTSTHFSSLETGSHVAGASLNYTVLYTILYTILYTVYYASTILYSYVYSLDCFSWICLPLAGITVMLGHNQTQISILKQLAFSWTQKCSEERSSETGSLGLNLSTVVSGGLLNCRWRSHHLLTLQHCGAG